MDNNSRIKPVRKKYLGPESDFYDRCKGEEVQIELLGDDRIQVIRVQLDWVDRYTIGVRDALGSKFMVNKSAIRSLGRDKPTW